MPRTTDPPAALLRRRLRHLQPVCLAMLAQQPATGYELLRALSRQPLLTDAPPDGPGIYRALQTLARSGLLRGRRLPPGKGPVRRQYTLTPAGHRALGAWLRALRETRADVDLAIRLVTRGMRTRRGGAGQPMN